VNKVDEVIREIAVKSYKEHCAIREKMCIEEFERILREQIESGDFVQHINNAADTFALTYIPYREKLRLSNKVDELEKKLAEAEQALKHILKNAGNLSAAKHYAKFYFIESLEEKEA
jgi:beta-glucosidase-like glycosyl hydrolase